MAGTARLGRARLGMAWQGMAGGARHGKARRGAAWRGRRGEARFGTAGRGMARQGRQGMAWRGWAWQSKARRGRHRKSMKEDEEQKIIVRWFRDTYPQHAMSLRCSQSGGFRGKGRQGAIRTAKATAMGAVTGESDIAILLPRGGYGSLVLEHKADGSSHRASPAQEEYISYHNLHGNCGVITRGLDAAKAAIEAYMEQE